MFVVCRCVLLNVARGCSLVVCCLLVAFVRCSLFVVRWYVCCSCFVIGVGGLCIVVCCFCNC